MSNRPENKTYSNFSSEQNFRKKTMGTAEKICCVLTFALCVVISFLLLLFCYKYSGVVHIIGNIVTILLGLMTILPFFGIGVKINNTLVKGMLVAAFIGLAVGGIGANSKYYLYAERTDTDPESHSSEAVISESENLNAEPAPPVETISNNPVAENDPIASPALTEIPSHADPVTITPDPTPSESAQPYIIKDFYPLIDPGYNKESELVPLSAENKTFWSPYLANKIRYLVNIDTQINGAFINGDTKFTALTAEANRLAEDIKTNGRNFEKQLKLIELRESAYECYPTYNLRKMLSDDYFSLAELYKPEGDTEEAYRCYLKSVKYELLAIRRCQEEGDNFYIHLYNLAKRLHAIGDLQNLGMDNKMEAYYLSACLFESISKSILSIDATSYQAGSCYYAGMVNHKLMNLAWGKNDPNSSYYFLDAYNYYVASLGYDGDKQHKNSYLADLCAWAQKYIRRFGEADGMLSSSDYRQLQAEYETQALVAENDPLSSPS